MVIGNSISNTYLLYYDRKGNLLNKVSLADVKDIYHIAPAEHQPAIDFFDLDRNSLADLVSVHDEKMELYGPGGDRSLSLDLPQSVSATQLRCVSIGANTYLCMFNSETALCHIFHLEQKTMKEFKATALPAIYDLFNDGKPYALVVNGKELRCVRL
jgi:hypothetical protein